MLEYGIPQRTLNRLIAEGAILNCTPGRRNYKWIRRAEIEWVVRQRRFFRWPRPGDPIPFMDLEHPDVKELARLAVRLRDNYGDDARAEMLLALRGAIMRGIEPKLDAEKYRQLARSVL